MTSPALERSLECMDETLIGLKNKNNLPGLGVGIVRDGTLVYSKGFGLANIEKCIPVTTETIFRIGSISKTFTAVGVMQLFEQGKFDLDDPVNDYLKTYQIRHRNPDQPAITFRHILTHTSGIGEVRRLSDLLLPLGGLGSRPDTPPPSLGNYYRGRLLAETTPGEKWAYANHAFATLGQLIEDISGEPFAEYMLEHVFKPLGMQHSDYILSDRVREEFAQGYNFKKAKFIPVPYQRIEVAGAGSIFSSVHDMAKYMAMLLAGGRSGENLILKPDTLSMMMSPQLEFNPKIFGMGLAFILTQYGDHRIVWHNGGWVGFTSAMYLAPDDGLGVVVFTNASNPAPDALASKILHQLLDVPDPVIDIPKKGILEEPHHWPELVGSYGPKKGFLTNLRTWMGYGGEVDVIVRGPHLVLRGLIGPLAKGLFLTRSDPADPLLYEGVLGESVFSVQFQRDSSGRIARLQIGPTVFYKRPAVESVRYRVLSLLGVVTGGVILWLISRKRK